MKKFLILLFSLFVGLISFSSAFTGVNPVASYKQVNKDGGTYSFSTGQCIVVNDLAQCVSSEIYNSNNELLYSTTSLFVYCFDTNGYYKNVGYNSCRISVYDNYFSNQCVSCPECEECSEINTGSILSGNCDTNYCVENDLCPVPSNFSQLFINDLEFPGKPLINVNIPDYITWDYSSYDSGFDLYVGSGYDEDYMQSIIDINSYRPTSEDFTSIFVSGLTLIFPYLIFALFIVFMRKLIKRIFKH